MAFTLWNVSVILISYAIMLVAGHFIVESVVSRLWKRYLPSTERHTPLPAIVGTFDRFLFATSYLLGVKEFIAVWLAIKLAGQWSPTKTDVDRPLYYIFHHWACAFPHRFMWNSNRYPEFGLLEIR